MAISDILIGSQPRVPASTIRVTANAVQEDLSFPTGHYYINDPTNNDLLAAWVTMLNTHTQLTGCTATLRQDGLIGTDFNGTTTTVDWLSATEVRDLLGYTGTTASGTTSVADEQSKWIWIPGKQGIYRARLGSDGNPVRDTAVGQSGPGTVRARTINTRRENRLEYPYVKGTRVWTNAEGAGEYIAFWSKVLAEFYQWKLYRGFDNDGTSTGWSPTNPIPSVGAYVLDDKPPIRFPYRRESAAGFNRVESRIRVELECVSTPEYS